MRRNQRLFKHSLPYFGGRRDLGAEVDEGGHGGRLSPPPAPRSGVRAAPAPSGISLSPDKGSGKIQLTTDGAAAAAEARGSPSLGPHPAADREVPLGRGLLGVDVGPEQSCSGWRDPALCP